MTDGPTLRIDMEGRIFGRLQVLGYAGHDNYRRAMWACLCVCGVIKPIAGKSLRAGQTRSCGCLQRERSRR